jgi:hypothetical protein
MAGFLNRFPDSIVALILSSYLSLIDIVNLDSSLLNHQERSALISSYPLIQSLPLQPQETINILFARWISKRFINLFSFRLSDGDLFDSDIREIFTSCHYIRDLTLIGGQYTNRGLSFILSHCQQLQSIQILDNAFVSSFSITDSRSTATHLRNLRSIDISGCSSAQDGLLEFVSTHCTNIASLSLRDCWSLTDHGLLSMIQNCAALEYLDLSHCSQFSDIAISQIPQHLLHLRSLNLSNLIDLTVISLLPITAMVTLQKLNLSNLLWTPLNVFQQIASQLPHLIELRLCSYIDTLGNGTPLLEIMRVLSTGCLRLEYISLAGSSISDPILMMLTDTSLFPCLVCLDLSEDDCSINYPLPYYDIDPEIVQRLCSLRQPDPKEPPFVLIDPFRYFSRHDLRGFDAIGEDADSDMDDDDDVYGDIVTYSQLPEYYRLTGPSNDPYGEAEGYDDDEYDEWDA